MSNNKEQLSETDEINAADDRFAANAAMQINSLRQEYRQPIPFPEASQLTLPTWQGQNFRLWQQQLQRQQLYHHQQDSTQSHQAHNFELEENESFQESASYEGEDEEDYSQSLMSPVGSEVFERQDQNGSSLTMAEKLVDMMPEYPTLWNTRLRSYKDLNAKESAWNEIASKLNTQGQ